MFSSQPFLNPYFSGYPTVGNPYSYGHPQPSGLQRKQAQHAQRQRQRDRARAYIPHEYGYVDSSDDDDYARYDYGLGHAHNNPYEYLYGKQTNSDESPRKVRFSSPPPPPRKAPSPKPAKPVPSLEVQEAAASKIQQVYRTHKSLSAINSLESKFNGTKSLFTFPTVVDFQDPQDREKVLSIDSSTANRVSPASSSRSDSIPKSCSHPSLLKPKLAYTSQNGALHTYIEALNRLLTSLDAVQSWGEQSVRQRRKDVVRRIECELGDVEGIDPDPEENIPEADLLKGWKGLWRRFLSQPEQSEPDVLRHTDAEPDEERNKEEEKIPAEEEKMSPEEKMPVEERMAEEKMSGEDEGVDVSFDEPTLDTTTAEEMEVEEGQRPVDVHIPKQDDFVIV